MFLILSSSIHLEHPKHNFSTFFLNMLIDLIIIENSNDLPTNLITINIFNLIIYFWLTYWFIIGQTSVF